jgi:hypothetical protein
MFQVNRTDEPDNFVAKIIYTIARIIQLHAKFIRELINSAFYCRAASFHSVLRVVNEFIALKCSEQYCEKQRRTRGRAY